MNDSIKERGLELIEKYHAGKINANESEELKRLIQENEPISKEWKTHYIAIENIQAAGNQMEKKRFLQMFDSVEHHEELKETQKDILSIKRIMRIASIFVGFLLLSLVYFNQTGSDNHSELFEDPTVEVLRAASDNPNDEWAEALELYSTQSYEAALPIFKKLSQDVQFMEEHMGRLSLLEGVSFMRINKYNQALSSFERISETNPFYDQRQWYEALNFWKQGKNQEAKSLLLEISQNESHYKQIQAKSFLKTLPSD